jgi:hypothetical protein
VPAALADRQPVSAVTTVQPQNQCLMVPKAALAFQIGDVAACGHPAQMVLMP